MMEHNSWQNVPLGTVSLLPQEVHIWRTSLEAPTHVLEDLKVHLNVDELQKAGRFYFERDRRRYIVAHGVLRILLAHYLQQSPAALQFHANAYGKPALAALQIQPPLQFNLSHSQEMALFAFVFEREIGVDIEYMRTNIEFNELARYSFSAHEYAAWSALPVEQQLQGFYHCWTRKEAYIKARGLGLSLKLNLFDVSLRPGEPAALLASREDPAEAARWSIYSLLPNPGYMGALVVEGQGWTLRTFDWRH